MKKVFVTGGLGQIGSHVAEMLLSLDFVGIPTFLLEVCVKFACGFVSSHTVNLEPGYSPNGT